jgi:hypothetical protein
MDSNLLDYLFLADCGIEESETLWSKQLQCIHLNEWKRHFSDDYLGVRMQEVGIRHSGRGEMMCAIS